MKVRIADLPAEVAEEDLRQLLGSSEDIRDIKLFLEGDSDSPVAVVETGSDAAAEGVIQVVNGRNWKGVTLRADKLLH